MTLPVCTHRATSARQTTISTHVQSGRVAGRRRCGCVPTPGVLPRPRAVPLVCCIRTDVWTRRPRPCAHAAASSSGRGAVLASLAVPILRATWLGVAVAPVAPLRLCRFRFAPLPRAMPDLMVAVVLRRCGVLACVDRWPWLLVAGLALLRVWVCCPKGPPSPPTAPPCREACAHSPRRCAPSRTTPRSCEISHVARTWVSY